MDNVRHEAIEQVKRIRNHSNVALWCGNNESDEGWHNWGWQKAHAISKKDSATIWEGYKRIFHKVLPEVVSTYDPQKFYMPSSPMHGWGHEESMREGSAHYWGVWWGALPFEMYLEKVPRFMSEYGFQAMPTLVTIREFQEEDDDYLFSPTLRCHQKHLTGYETINIYLEREGLKPNTLEDFIYQSQLIQAKGIGMAIEAHRRAKPYCMGSLLWQINDCWPVVSWSSIDAFGNWKALQYRLRELYDDIMVSVIDHKDNVEIYVVSDRLTETKGTVEVNLVDFNGQETNVFTENLTVASNASRQVLVKQSREIFMGIDTATTLIECIFKTPEKEYSNQKFIVPYGEINLPVPEISTRVEPAEHGYNIYLTSNAFTAYAQLYLTKSHACFSDNFINLFPNREYAIFCCSIYLSMNSTKTKNTSSCTKRLIKDIAMRTNTLRLTIAGLFAIMAVSCKRPMGGKPCPIRQSVHWHRCPRTHISWCNHALWYGSRNPNTRLEGWDGHRYHYSDRVIYGFTHTALNGTGVGDYGDILLMPVVGEPTFPTVNTRRLSKRRTRRLKQGTTAFSLTSPLSVPS